MAKTETQIDLKINKGTYAKIQENLSQIGENELIIADDINIPLPDELNEGKGIISHNNKYVFEDVQLKNLITDIETHKTENDSYPSTKAVYDYCQSIGAIVIEMPYNYGSTMTQADLSKLNNNLEKPVFIIQQYASDGATKVFSRVRVIYNNNAIAYHDFECLLDTSLYYIRIDANTGFISGNINAPENLEKQGLKTSSITGTGSTLYYPNTKAVYDFVNSKIEIITLYASSETFDINDTYDLEVPITNDLLEKLANGCVVNFITGLNVYLSLTTQESGIIECNSIFEYNNKQYIASLSIDTSILSGDNATLSFSEIQGGSGGGGTGESNVLYKHSLDLVIDYDGGRKENGTVEFLSKYDTQFVNNGSLADFLTSMQALYISTQDVQLYFSLKVRDSNDGINFISVAQIIPEDTGLEFEIVATQGLVLSLSALFTDNTAGITDTVTPYIQVSGGSSTGGGSGKLYEITMDLTRYDDSGNAVTWTGDGGISTSTLPLTIHIYESNFEKIKEKFNDFVDLYNQTFGQSLGITFPHITDINSLVSFINTYVIETVADGDTLSYYLIQALVNLSDKAYFEYTYTDVPYYFNLNASVFSLDYVNGTANGQLDLAFEYNSDDRYYALNVNNSCTLTEYGTSGGGSSQPTIPERFSLAYNLVVNINQEQFTGGSWTGTNNDNIRTFQYNGSNADETKSKELVEFLTGVNVLDSYNATKPTPCFVFCTQSNICWKLQWDNSLLHAYKVENFPFVVKEKYYRFVLNDNSCMLQLFIRQSDMQDVYDRINQVLGSNISTPQEVVGVYNQLKGDSLPLQTFVTLCSLFTGVYSLGFMHHLPTSYYDGHDMNPILARDDLNADLIYIRTSSISGIFNPNGTAGYIAHSSNATLAITENTDLDFD